MYSVTILLTFRCTFYDFRRPGSLLRLWRCINHLLTYLLTYMKSMSLTKQRDDAKKSQMLVSQWCSGKISD